MTTGIRRKRHGHAWLALAGYLLLTLGLTYPLVTQFGRAIPGDGFDGWQNYWNLWWIKTALLEQHTHPWFTNMLYYPTGVGLLFHTLNAFNGFITLPIQLVFGLLPAYNAAVLLSFTLGGLGAYLLARYVLGPGSSRLAAFAAGVIFTFSPFHIAHLLGHMQVISLEWIPFYALYLLKTVQCGLDWPRGSRAWKLASWKLDCPPARAEAVGCELVTPHLAQWAACSVLPGARCAVRLVLRALLPDLHRRGLGLGVRASAMRRSAPVLPAPRAPGPPAPPPACSFAPSGPSPRSGSSGSSCSARCSSR